jgi:predicted Zn finger-like uncharacterized protein
VKFACPKCKTRYSIADEKVPPVKTLRFPCKKCGNTIRLQRKRSVGKKARDPAPSPAGFDKKPGPHSGAATQVASAQDIQQALAAEPVEPAAPPDEIGSVSDELGSASDELGSASDEFGSASDEFGSASDELGSASDELGSASDELGSASDVEWYVLVGGKQRGPMGAPSVIEMLTNNEIDKRTYVWRDGMEAWERLGEVTEFGDLAQRVGDAAWRVMAPLDDHSASASTVAMDMRQLREQIQRTVGESASIEDEQTGMDLDGSRAAITAPTGDPNERPTKVGQPVDLHDPAVVDALVGEPTGERMTRSLTDDPSQPLLTAARAAGEPRSAAPPPLVPPAQTQALSREARRGVGADLLGFDDDITGEVADSAPVSFSESTEKPADDLGPALSDAFPGGELVAMGGMPPNGYDVDAPPGESTRVFMATAGLYKRRRVHRIAAAAGVLFTLFLITILSLDILKVIELPGMGALYARTGILDPNPDRGIRRVENELAQDDLSVERRAALEQNRAKYRKLMLRSSVASEGRGRGRHRRNLSAAATGRGTVDNEGVKDTRELDDGERNTLKDVFADDRKSENAIRLAEPEHIETPNLPDGLSQKAIAAVVTESGRSIQLCFSESTRKGEQLAGKMEMRVTISPDGSVTNVDIITDEFKRTSMGNCTTRRVKNWRFPKFNGESIDVVVPYHVYPVL